MTVLRAVVVGFFVVTTTFSFAANVPRSTPSNNVVVCQAGARCIHHDIFGHDYKILSTDRFAVMVFLSNEGRYTRADVSITNLTSAPVSLSPEEFRIEAVSVRSKVFPYVRPENLDVQAQGLFAEAPLVNETMSEHEAARQRAMQEAAALAAKTPHLKAITIPPNQAVHGRVYFERDAMSRSQQVNVVLPIADTVFQFPDVIKP
jgi:hypothetical protein